MRLFNPGRPFILMRWDEFAHLIRKLPKDEWRHYLHIAGYRDDKEIDKLLLEGDEKTIDRMFIEMEEQI